MKPLDERRQLKAGLRKEGARARNRSAPAQTEDAPSADDTATRQADRGYALMRLDAERRQVKKLAELRGRSDDPYGWSPFNV